MSVSEKLTALADAIRGKTQGTAQLTLEEMALEIQKIPKPYTASASGDVITLTDSAALPVRNLAVYGKTLQAGVPSTAAPVEFSHAGSDGSITVTIGDGEVTMQTPNGLPGIPVDSGGNYMDETGQMWLCDEIDFERGVYVQNLEIIRAEDYRWSCNTGWTEAHETMAFAFLAASVYTVGYSTHALSNRLKSMVYTKYSAVTEDTVMVQEASGNGIIYIVFPKANLTEISSTAVNAYLKTAGIEILIRKAEPVETALSSDVWEALKGLCTADPQTVVTNDGGAGMTIHYAADAERYIANLLAE